MKKDAKAIDRLLGRAGQPYRRWFLLGVGGAIVGAVYLSGANRNLLYLSMLFSTIVVTSVLLRRWWAALLAVVACAYLASVPAVVADLGTLYPAPRDRAGTDNMWVTGIKEGETWTYRFTLRGLGKAGGGAGPSGHLYIDGRSLSNLVVCVQGRTLEGSAFCSKKIFLDHIAIPLEAEGADTLTVSLRGMPHTTPRVFHGPEVHGFNVYGDAVWLEFDRVDARLIYEAGRTVSASAPR